MDANWCPDCGEPREKCLGEGQCETGRNIKQIEEATECEQFCQQVEREETNARMHPVGRGYMVSIERAQAIVHTVRTLEAIRSSLRGTIRALEEQIRRDGEEIRAMQKPTTGDKVLVEQCWEDESGVYHDEYAEIVSVDPFKLKFVDVSDEVRAYLERCEFTIDEVEKVSEPTIK